jgi:hypothetical protein
MDNGGGDGLAETDPHRAVGAGVEARTGVEARQLGEADVNVSAPSALRKAFFGIHAATSRRAR